MERDDIWWVTLPPAVDSGPAGRRPVVVIQNNELSEAASAPLSS
jgi:mRNA-degrading endonuclease toxin of MazEF toxin-antitoxin module